MGLKRLMIIMWHYLRYGAHFPQYLAVPSTLITSVKRTLQEKLLCDRDNPTIKSWKKSRFARDLHEIKSLGYKGESAVSVE